MGNSASGHAFRDFASSLISGSRGIPAPLGRPLADAARHGFTDGMAAVFMAACAVALLTAALELAAMPGREERAAQLARLDESALGVKAQEAR